MLASVAAVLAIAFSVNGCSDSSSPSLNSTPHITVSQKALDNSNAVWADQPGFIHQAMGIQNRHTQELLNIDGVVGTSTGVDEVNPGVAQILVLTSRDGVRGIPASIEGVRTRVEMVGVVKPFGGYTNRYRPIKGGVSTGNDNECASGTIGCLLSLSSDGTHRYMLSNNHVFARENDASTGEKIDQPGRYDTHCGASGLIGRLSAFSPISFTDTNVIDAAVAVIEDSLSSAASGAMINGYVPSTTVVSPSVNLNVTKVGRTSGVTTGKITGINTVIRVSYSGGTAIFKNQIYVHGTFIRAGDSGSLMMTNNSSHNPVGLDFAGGSNSSFANPIGPILSYFGASVDNN